MSSYRVVKPCAQVTLLDDNGTPNVRLLYKGAKVPDNVDPACLKSLRARGFVGKETAAKPVASQPAAASQPTAG